VKDHLKPYYAVDKIIYFTDRVEEVLVYTFDRADTAKTMSELLNNAYNAAYQDGLNTSLNEHYKEILDKMLSLSIENSRLQILANKRGVKPD
jgi:hypothetical protein